MKTYFFQIRRYVLIKEKGYRGNVYPEFCFIWVFSTLGCVALLAQNCTVTKLSLCCVLSTSGKQTTHTHNRKGESTRTGNSLKDTFFSVSVSHSVSVNITVLKM